MRSSKRSSMRMDSCKLESCFVKLCSGGRPEAIDVAYSLGWVVEHGISFLPPQAEWQLLAPDFWLRTSNFRLATSHSSPLLPRDTLSAGSDMDLLIGNYLCFQ